MKTPQGRNPWGLGASPAEAGRAEGSDVLRIAVITAGSETTCVTPQRLTSRGDVDAGRLTTTRAMTRCPRPGRRGGGRDALGGGRVDGCRHGGGRSGGGHDHLWLGDPGARPSVLAQRTGQGGADPLDGRGFHQVRDPNEEVRDQNGPEGGERRSELGLVRSLALGPVESVVQQYQADNEGDEVASGEPPTPVDLHAQARERVEDGVDLRDGPHEQTDERLAREGQDEDRREDDGEAPREDLLQPNGVVLLLLLGVEALDLLVLPRRPDDRRRHDDGERHEEVREHEADGVERRDLDARQLLEGTQLIANVRDQGARVPPEQRLDVLLVDDREDARDEVVHPRDGLRRRGRDGAEPFRREHDPHPERRRPEEERHKPAQPDEDREEEVHTTTLESVRAEREVGTEEEDGHEQKLVGHPLEVSERRAVQRLVRRKRLRQLFCAHERLHCRTAVQFALEGAARIQLRLKPIPLRRQAYELVRIEHGLPALPRGRCLRQVIDDLPLGTVPGVVELARQLVLRVGGSELGVAKPTIEEVRRDGGPRCVRRDLSHAPDDDEPGRERPEVDPGRDRERPAAPALRRGDDDRREQRGQEGPDEEGLSDLDGDEEDPAPPDHLGDEADPLGPREQLLREDGELPPLLPRRQGDEDGNDLVEEGLQPYFHLNLQLS